MGLGGAPCLPRLLFPAFSSPSLPLPALPCPTAPCHGARRALEDSRAPREQLGRSPAASSPGSLSMESPQPRAFHTPDHPHTPERSPVPQPGASLPVLSPLPIPNIPASLKHSSSPEQPCVPESLGQPWHHPCSPQRPWQHPCILGNIPAASGIPDSIPANCLDHPPAPEHSPTSLRALRPPGLGDWEVLGYQR